MVRQQTDGLNQRDVALDRIGGQQRESDRGGVALGAVAYQPPAGLPHSLPIRAQRRGNDVVVVMDRNVDIAEGIDKVARLYAGVTEVPVEMTATSAP